jgi:hypothetical protein
VVARGDLGLQGVRIFLVTSEDNSVRTDFWGNPGPQYQSGAVGLNGGGHIINSQGGVVVSWEVGLRLYCFVTDDVNTYLL